MDEIQLNKNQCQVLAVLFYNNKAGNKYLTSPSIKEQCGFEKNATVTGCLMGLIHAGLVEVETQELLDKTLKKFFYIPDEVIKKVCSNITFMKMKEE